MNIEEKSLALAELMGWKLKPNMWREPQWFIEGRFTYLRPYNKEYVGKAQFASILLKFPEVFKEFWYQDSYGTTLLRDIEMTQENILDEILKMKGKWVK